MPKTDLEIRNAAKRRAEGNIAFLGLKGKAAADYEAIFMSGAGTVLQTLRENGAFQAEIVDAPNGEKMRRLVLRSS